MFERLAADSTRLRAARRDARRAGGFTLVELLVTLAIVAIVAMVATPSFDDFRVRERLKGAATNLFTDLQFARSESVQRNAQVSITFAAGAGWCYGIHQGNAACNCAIDPPVAGSCSIKHVRSADFPGVSIGQAQFDAGGGPLNWYVIDPRRGQSIDAAGNPVTGNVVFAAAGSRSVRGDVNAVGRVKLCSPSGSVTGYPAC